MNERNADLKFETRVIHECILPEDWDGATLPPICQSASHRHQTAESLSETFAGRQRDHIYMRLTNPTNSVLEKKLASLENGRGAVFMSSGMAAITNTCMALLRSGDEFVASRSLFMSTYLLFKRVFAKYDIRCRLVDPLDLAAMEEAITDRTRFLYLETITNPGMEVPDLRAAADLAHRHGLPLVVDSTLATPWLCRPLEHGADVVIHSTTKYLSGHGNAVGGVVIDGGTFDWLGSERFPDFAPFVERKGELALLDKIWREHHINFGTTAAPLHAYLAMIGLDTLALRMERHMANTREVARYLQAHPRVRWIRYPGLPEHPSHATAQNLFKGKGYGGLLSFGLKDQETCFRFIDNLKLVYHLANLGDCKTLVIHPASSQYISFPDQEREDIGISSDLLRLSVGIEDVDDIVADLEQALASL
ncbi:O-acetylhomoserine aminocarboxypropyltransferase/cysteine synthase family protein [Desulfolithobacter sp.]